MAKEELEIIREKARREGYEAGLAEGDATARATAVVELRAALKCRDTAAEVVDVVDALAAGPCSGTDKSVIELRDRMLGRTTKTATKPGETQTQAAERMLRENGIVGSKANSSASAQPDLGDLVVAKLEANRGVK